ncbi:DNA-binding transcriptional regulator, AcrR family [Amycolatopsis arida]|uniref:DNA-binding transcriptional regulator, AcrR family n=1 Tax=Amycolatopsis arida TaxID=587909 RepID=A0A1I5MEC1_9PSEU|nr:TetR/AcrR family transcriptional regulator [Amycolatopsis arida]TDX94066.1 AcrR family transcriptional regulator [Amycolatopsis arida]SFP07944.1 DNA-binding transcriptional regulator, AcrR family [Amycolatopsis arida]
MTEVKGGRRQMYAARTRADILAAATDLFATRGFDGTAISDIGKAARASKGTVYHHFADKQEIFAEVFTTVQSAVMRTALDAMAAEGDPWARLHRATRAFLRGYVSDSTARSILRQALGVLGWDRVRELDEATALPVIRATLERFLADGEIRQVRVDAAAQLVFDLYCNAVLVITAAEDPDRAAGDVETIVLSLLGGLRPEGRADPGPWTEPDEPESGAVGAGR